MLAYHTYINNIDRYPREWPLYVNICALYLRGLINVCVLYIIMLEVQFNGANQFKIQHTCLSQLWWLHDVKTLNTSRLTLAQSALQLKLGSNDRVVANPYPGLTLMHAIVYSLPLAFSIPSVTMPYA